MHKISDSIITNYFVSYIIYGSALLATSSAKPRGIESRIIGGQYAKEGDAPWMVSLYYTKNLTWGGHICGGSLIGPSSVITAAHCVK